MIPKYLKTKNMLKRQCLIKRKIDRIQECKFWKAIFSVLFVKLLAILCLPVWRFTVSLFPSLVLLKVNLYHRHLKRHSLSLNLMREVKLSQVELNYCICLCFWFFTVHCSSWNIVRICGLLFVNGYTDIRILSCTHQYKVQ